MNYLQDKKETVKLPRSFAVLQGNKFFPNKDRVISWSLGSIFLVPTTISLDLSGFSSK